MTIDELNHRYFEWMYQLVCNDEISYRKLLTRLHEHEFYYLISMDENRAEDGKALRYRFGYENSVGKLPENFTDRRPCSVLEMMLALALRCEENIMDDPSVGNRVSQWFWSMIDSLGLRSMSDANYNEQFTDNVLRRFLDREYSRDGEGGLFTVNGSAQDMRSIEIWYQMCWYLNNFV